MEKLTKKEISRVVSGLLTLIENNNQAVKLLSDPAMIKAIKKENAFLLEIINKL